MSFPSPLASGTNAEDRKSVPTVLFFTDNGKGLGHVTRMLAVAKQATGRFRPVFLTMSLGYGILRKQGMAAEFFPAYHKLGLTKSEWLPFLKSRLSEIIRDTGSRVVVVDHVTPPRSFEELRAETTGVEWVWSRRALWRRDKNEGALDLADGFDQVVEPGDLASPIDVGASTRQKGHVRALDPIVVMQPSEYLSREEARRRLGIPHEGRALLLNIGAPDHESLTAIFYQVKGAIESVRLQEQIHLFAPLHPLHATRLQGIEGINFAPVYPVSRYFNAFDGAISLAGYNSFHEVVTSGLPAIFIPHSSTNVDDQERRARFGELIGRSHWAPTVDDDHFRLALERLLDPAEVDVARRVTDRIGPLCGAAQFADLIAEAVERADSVSLSVPEPWVDEDARTILYLKMHSGSRNRHGRPPTVVVVACPDHTTDNLIELATQIPILQRSHPGFTPIVLIGKASPAPLVERGLVFESVMSADEWATMGTSVTYADYLRSRIEGARQRYSAAWVVELTPGDDLDALTKEKMVDQSPMFVVDDEHRSFRLDLPSISGHATRRLDIDVPCHLSIPRQLQAEGLAAYEPESLACWMAILSRPDPGAAVDVGANVGPYAWLAAALTPRDVRAFEPVPQLARALASVSQRNDLEVTIEELALADREGVATLFLSDRSDSSHSLLRGFRRSSESIEVELTTLDSYFRQTGIVPHAVKIDTETTEPEVLAGAWDTLAAHRPWLIVEVLAQRSEERLQNVMEPLGYWWYQIDDRFPLRRADAIVGDRQHRQMNWLLAPMEPEPEFWEKAAVWREALRSCVPDEADGPSQTRNRLTESNPAG